MRLVETCFRNQWPATSFHNRIDSDIRAEVRIASAYDVPIRLQVIRNEVMQDICACALPAGNA